MTVKLRDRHHLHLVLLAGLKDRPATGADLAKELSRRSGGRLALGIRSIYSELHHLARNALVASDGPGRYRLTDAGLRSLRHRERKWADYVAAVDGARAAGRPDDRDGHRAAPERELRSGSRARRAARSPR
jgi:DNA-binding PadR family transcriptional regulator